MEQLFTTIIYQPFLNILVFFYWLLGQIGLAADMGIAVILLTIVIRLLLLPVSLASDRSEHEREDISKRAKKIQQEYSSDPVAMDRELKKIMKTNPRILVAEFFELAINVAITLMLIRLFATGLEGADLPLLYPWIPHPPTPYNLVFLGRFDLAQPNFFLNVLQSVVILLVEIAAEYTSPFRNILSMERPREEFNAITRPKNRYARETRNRVRMLQVALPVVSFLVFMFLPAGKKLFIITTLMFSLLLMILKAIRRKFIEMFPAPEPIVEVIAPSKPEEKATH